MMKRIIIYTVLSVVCLTVGAIIGSYFTKNKMQQIVEIKIHEAIIQELDDFQDGLLEAAVLYYAGNTYGTVYSGGEKLTHVKLQPDSPCVKNAEQVAWFVSKFLDDCDIQRRLKGVSGNYGYDPIDYPLNLIRSEADSIAKLYESTYPDNIDIYTKSPWDNDITINKRFLLPFRLPAMAPRSSRPEKVRPV